jgi:acyl-CoA synthetase (AMP-forming)/AMP-acid ligase II
MSRLHHHGTSPAIVWAGRTVSYAELTAAIDAWDQRLAAHAIDPGRVVAIAGDFSPETVAALLALFVRRCIAVPLAARPPEQMQRLLATAQATALLTFGAEDAWTVADLEHASDHPLIEQVRASRHAAITLFSSGSTGDAKASLHDVERWIGRLEAPGTPRRTLSFLLFDHGGGFNTLIATLMTGGLFVVPRTRDVDPVCRLIEAHRVELLPTSPTFLRLLLMADGHRRFDLSSLRLITYGTEPMHESTLRALHQALPSVRLKQTYGLTELGAFRTKSRGDDSLWVAIGGEGLETKVIDNILYIRTRAAMLGYLNAPQPFDEDGWYCTGDVVEVKDDYFLIRGRAHHLINVGGEKVHPIEVEDVVMELDNVRDVTVTAKRSHVTGHVVVATVALRQPEDASGFSARARAFCQRRLEPYKVPVLFHIVDDMPLPAGVKKMRRSEA